MNKNMILIGKNDLLAIICFFKRLDKNEQYYKYSKNKNKFR